LLSFYYAIFTQHYCYVLRNCSALDNCHSVNEIFTLFNQNNWNSSRKYSSKSFQHFGDNSSLFNIRYRCLKLKMNESDDFSTHVGVVNRECERLQSEKFADIRTRLLHRLDQEPTLSLNDIAAEYQRLTNLKHDTAL
ncbi:Gap-Pol polyprotein, partial [Schistosoma japonicum]